MPDNIKILPAQDKYVPGYCAALNSVAAEREYLSVYGGFTVEGSRGFTEFCRENGYPQLFAVDSASDLVIGWCDVVARAGCPSNVGFLGVGLLRDYRGKGTGTALIKNALEEAYEAGFRVIRLEVREKNQNAIALYEKLGFKRYRRRAKGLCIEGEYFPVVYMKKRLSGKEFK